MTWNVPRPCQGAAWCMRGGQAPGILVLLLGFVGICCDSLEVLGEEQASVFTIPGGTLCYGVPVHSISCLSTDQWSACPQILGGWSVLCPGELTQPKLPSNGHFLVLVL